MLSVNSNGRFSGRRELLSELSPELQEITAGLQGARITVPTLFIAGEQDMVIAGANRGRLQGAMGRVVDDLREVVLLLLGIGRWFSGGSIETVRPCCNSLRAYNRAGQSRGSLILVGLRR